MKELVGRLGRDPNEEPSNGAHATAGAFCCAITPLRLGYMGKLSLLAEEGMSAKLRIFARTSADPSN